MIAFQLVGGLVTGFMLVALAYEWMTTGRIATEDGDEFTPGQAAGAMILMLILFIACVGPALMPAAPGVCL